MKGKYHINNTKYIIFVNCLSLILLIGDFLYLIISWSAIPNSIPGHYNYAGVVDRWGCKNELWILPITSLIFFIDLTILGRFPQVWNTVIKVTEKNRDQVYQILKSMLDTLKAGLIAVFTYMDLTQAMQRPLSVLFIPVFLILVFGTIGFFIVRLIKVK